MSELLDQIPPIEEGNIEALKQTHSIRLEESLNGNILKILEDPIERVKKIDTIFGVHERVYTNLLREFTIELHRLIPEAADTDKILQEDEQTRKRRLVEKFEKIIIKTDQTNVLGGHISRFTQLNAEKSKSTGEEIFEKIYKHQLQAQTGAPTREMLEAKYYREAVGPAKDKLFQDLISQVPGPPQNVTMNLETQMLSWEKPLVNADAVDCCYFVEWQSRSDTKREKVHTNQLTLKMLKPKTNYFIKVQGFNDHKNRFGEYSTVFIRTRARKPGKPNMPYLSPQTEKTAKLTITMLSAGEQNGSPVMNIIISRRSDKNYHWESQPFPVDSSQGEFQTLLIHVSCKDNEEILYFRYQFENEAGVSEPSDTAQLEIVDMIPGKPENIRTTTSARQIQMTWDPPINNPGAVNSYLIQYWEKGDDQELFPSKSEKTVRHDERSLQLTSISPYTEYIIRVYAKNEKNKTAIGYGIL